MDVTIYNPNHNGSLFDLSKLPPPLTTNYSEWSLTELSPVNRNEFPLNVPTLPNVLFNQIRNFSTNKTEEMATIIDELEKDLNDTSPSSYDP